MGSMAMGKEKRGGMSTLLLGIRMFFNNPLSRVILRALSHEIEVNGRRQAIVYKALELYAGVDTTSCFTARFASHLMKGIIKFFMVLASGNEEEARNALRDPALIRGLTVVFQGLALYGATVPQKLPAPFQVVWNFTNMCNLACKHCYQRAGRALPNELNYEEKLRVIEQLDKANVPSLAFSGGEPTIHPHFLDMVYEASRRGMYVSVATNGMRFADIKFAEKAKKAGLRYVEVSIDSADPKKHDEFRGIVGCWEKAVKGLKNAAKLGLSTGMAVTLTRMNVDEVNDLINLAEDVGANRIIFFNFIPVGRGLENAEELDLNPLERERVLRKLARENSKRKIEVLSTAPQYGRIVLQVSRGQEISPTHFYVGSDPAVRALTEYIGGCGAGRIYCGIQPDGTVIPCVFMPIPVGSLRKETFWSIWITSQLMQDLRDREKLRGNGFCKKCPYKYICGGCRARAYAYTGDYLEGDPGCFYNIILWKKVKEKLRSLKNLESLQTTSWQSPNLVFK
ncbi:MAG: radical SAM protein [Desulfurococcales archaeon]|nr:radical SAM protein [Desulfurococcales archaeon]